MQSTTPAIPTAPRPSLLSLLSERRSGIYAIVDAARQHTALDACRESGAELISLYKGRNAEVLAQVAPYLVAVAGAGGDAAGQLFDRCWSRGMGVLLTSAVPLERLRLHLRKFLVVEIEGARRCYFRFYDPAILRVFLPTCNADQLQQFYGPIEEFWVADATGRRAVRMTLNGGRLQREELSVRDS